MVGEVGEVDAAALEAPDAGVPGTAVLPTEGRDGLPPRPAGRGMEGTANLRAASPDEAADLA
jgi:hypothetical protein